jgi:hypothetical protein
MPSGTKALLLNLNVILANNNVRKNISSLPANIQNANSDIQQVSTIVLANGGTYTWNAVAGNLVTVVWCSKALSMNVTLAGGGGFTKTISSLLVLTCEVTSIIFTNNNATDNAELIINGG